MSLLMDALKHAASSREGGMRKPVANGQHPANTTDFGLTPTDRGDQPSPSTPRPSNILRSPSEPHLAATGHAEAIVKNENRVVTRNTFGVKTALPTAHLFLRITLGALGLAAIGIAIYPGMQLQITEDEAGKPSHPPDKPPAPPSLPPSPPTPVITPNPGLTAGHAGTPTQARNANFHNVPRQSPTPGWNQASAVPDTYLQRGYRKAQDNSLAEARQDYEGVLHNDPTNVDSLLSLAAIAQRQGRTSDAAHYRQRALAADPRDPSAIALSSNGDSPDQEARLKTLLSAQPESALLNFALGNHYAKQGRWDEAQQAYFNAVAGDSGNPDFLFNLAVSLDQMHQSKVAAQHYRLALEAGEQRPAAFDHGQLQRRLNQLSP
jgi:tetratricopeptide (TPR) repeat protein